MRATTAVVFTALALAGCAVGAQNTGSVAAPAAPTVKPASAVDNARGTSAVPEVDLGEVGTLFDDRDDLVGASSTVVESWSAVDENTVAVHFVTGTPQCYGAHAEVHETDRAVTVSLVTGALPEAADKMCILVAVFGRLEVPLNAPLGDRQIVNG